MVLPLDSKLKASEFGLVTGEEAWERVVGRQMAGFRTYSYMAMRKRMIKFKFIVFINLCKT